MWSWVDRADGSMLVNPWGLWWEEVTASDIIRIDAAGEVIEGQWDVTPAIHIHTELHRNRADARVVVHNHPYHATVLAALGILPEILHQTTCMYDGDMVYVDEYDGEISDPSKGSALAQAIGDASIILLRNHGLIVTGETLAQATYRAASFDRQCRLMVDAAQDRPRVQDRACRDPRCHEEHHDQARQLRSIGPALCASSSPANPTFSTKFRLKRRFAHGGPR